MRLILFCVLFQFVVNLSFTQENQTVTRILFVLDASQSMLTKWGDSDKMDASRKIMFNLLDSLSGVKNLELALRVYGHQRPVPPQDCSDTRLEVAFETGNIHAIKQKLRQIKPNGTTPIAYALEMASHDFPECDHCRNIIIIITDGIEACDGDPCAVSQALQKQGIILKPFVIGVGLDENFKNTFDCVGQYFDASSEKKFRQVLGIVISQALNNTTAQVNLLDTYGKPTETNVNMTFYDRFSGKIRYNYIHTINHRGNPDTLLLDPLCTYNLVVQTIPPVLKDSIVITPGKHTIIAVDAPQGDLILKRTGLSDYRNLQFIVRKSNSNETLNIQDIDKTIKYLTGRYDLEILTLPRLKINDVEIKQSNTTTIQIPQPGLATFYFPASGYASLYVVEKDQQVLVCSINTENLSETLTLLPGSYVVVFRSKNVKESQATITQSFKILPGSSQRIKLY